MKTSNYFITFLFLYEFIISYANGFFPNVINPEVLKQENDYIKFGKALVDFLTYQCSFVKPTIPKTEVSPENTPIMLFINGTLIPFPILDAPDLISKHPNFNINSTTVIFSHGFMGDPNAKDILKLGSLMVPRGYNFLSFDMRHYLKRLDYSYVASVAEYLGDVLFDFVSKMHSKGLKTSNVHMIGFSLGAQVSGFVARKFKRTLNQNISRITGLDPASPCFINPGVDSLGPQDADQVDVVLTSILSYNPLPVGRAQYFVNGRYQIQPGCHSVPVWDFFCSHFRSRDLFVESVENHWAFMAAKCKDINVYDCQFLEISRMGYSSDIKDSGNFHLTTNSKYTFNRGFFGLY